MTQLTAAWIIGLLGATALASVGIILYQTDIAFRLRAQVVTNTTSTVSRQLQCSAPQNMPPGNYSVDVLAQDSQGNQVTKTVAITVLASTPTPTPTPAPPPITPPPTPPPVITPIITALPTSPPTPTATPTQAPPTPTPAPPTPTITPAISPVPFSASINVPINRFLVQPESTIRVPFTISVRGSQSLVTAIISRAILGIYNATSSFNLFGITF